jgi:hypothetical protein
MHTTENYYAPLLLAIRAHILAYVLSRFGDRVEVWSKGGVINLERRYEGDTEACRSVRIIVDGDTLVLGCDGYDCGPEISLNDPGSLDQLDEALGAWNPDLPLEDEGLHDMNWRRRLAYFSTLEPSPRLRSESVDRIKHGVIQALVGLPQPDIRERKLMADRAVSEITEPTEHRDYVLAWARGEHDPARWHVIYSLWELFPRVEQHRVGQQNGPNLTAVLAVVEAIRALIVERIEKEASRDGV